MEELNLLKKMGKVEAPPYFEQRVMTELLFRKKSRQTKKHLGMSFAGAFSALVVLFVIFNIFIIPHQGIRDYSSAEEGFLKRSLMRESFRQPNEMIPIMESVDYSNEIRSRRNEPPTVYILEQVSNTTDAKFIY